MNKIRKADLQHLITEADRMVAFRNRLIHSYDTIDDAFVWPILMKQLPILKKLANEQLQP